jgi:hypothetical protein
MSSITCLVIDEGMFDHYLLHWVIPASLVRHTAHAIISRMVDAITTDAGILAINVESLTLTDTYITEVVACSARTGSCSRRTLLLPSWGSSDVVVRDAGLASDDLSE